MFVFSHIYPLNYDVTKARSIEANAPPDFRAGLPHRVRFALLDPNPSSFICIVNYQQQWWR